MIGQTFGKLTVESQAESRNRHTYWNCVCACGKRLIVMGSSLRTGNSSTCGCSRANGTAWTHRMSGTPEHRAWKAMRQRCADKENEHYGGRGITIDPRWDSFEQFLKDMRPKPIGPPRYSVERRDTNGPYSPENCFWATQKQQCRNQRDNHLLTYRGEKKTLAEWSEEKGFKHGLLYNRIRLGWTPEQALETKPKEKRR